MTSPTFYSKTVLHFLSLTLIVTGNVARAQSTAVSINPGANPSVCQPASAATLHYSTPVGSPTTYSVVYPAAAVSAGFTNIPPSSLPSGSISLPVPTGVTGTYCGSLTVSRGSNSSPQYRFSITVYPTPSAAITSAPAPCTGRSTNIVLSGLSDDTIAYQVDGGATLYAVLNGGTYTLTTPPSSGSHTYHVLSTHNAACSAVTDTTLVLYPTPTQWTGARSTDWDTAANWSCGLVPSATDNVIVSSTATVMPNIKSGLIAAVRDLTVTTGASIAIQSGSVLHLKGTVNNSGTISGNGQCSIDAGNDQTIQGTGTFNNLDINNRGNVSIAPGASATLKAQLSITTGRFFTNDSLILASDSIGSAWIAPLPAHGALVSGKVTINQYFGGGNRAFRFFSHPFSNSMDLSQLEQYMDITGTGGATNGFTPTRTNSPSAYWYNTLTGNSSLPTDPGWTPFTSVYGTTENNKVHPYQGFLLFARGKKGQGLNGSEYIPSPTIISMSGNVNQGNQIITMVKGTGAHQDYNQIGNPYPAPVNIAAVVGSAKRAGKIAGAAFYVWNPYLGAAGQFQAIPIDTFCRTPYYLQPNTAFQVRAMNNGDSLIFTEANKGTMNTTNLLRGQQGYVTLTVCDENYHPWDMVYLKFNDLASANNEDLDGEKLNSSDFNFFTISADNQKLSLDARPFQNNGIIPLGIHSDYEKTYIIKTDELEVPSGSNLYLHDKWLNKTQLLQSGTTYSFTVNTDPKSQGNDRFELRMEHSEQPETQEKHINMRLSPNPATDVVNIGYNLDKPGSVVLRVLDILGVAVYQEQVEAASSGTITLPIAPFASGNYMVEMECGGKKTVQRLIKE